MKKISLLIVLLLITSVAFSADRIPDKSQIKNLPQITGNETVNAPVFYPPYSIPFGRGTDEIGDTIKVGTTWYGNQHNGTIGRMIEKDADGYIHMAWMNGLQALAIDRHVYYNFIDPLGAQGWPLTGIQADNAQRGGFCNLDADYGGVAIISFHETPIGQPNPITANSCDILPRTGGFLGYDVPNQPPPGMVNHVIWPHMQIDHQGKIQFAATESSLAAGDPQRIMYSRGTYDAASFSITYPTTNTWTYIDTTMTIAVAVGTSDVSDKVAFAWTHSRYYDRPDTGAPNQYNNDIYYAVSEDGINFDFANPVNLTNFVWPDPSLLPDTLAADKDTLRAYTDAECFYDMDGYLHIAFTTPMYYELEGFISTASSLVWHWSEQFPGLFSLVANGYSDSLYALPGAWHRTVQRPSMGQDPATGYLYCAYQQYMQDGYQISQGGFPSGDVFVSVSTNGGYDWSVGTNVTNTPTPDMAPPGACLSEVTPTINKVVDDYIHMLYVMDRDAGNVLQTEGGWTLNDVYYHRIPQNLIPQTPLMGHDIPFHWYDTSGVDPGYDPTQIVKVFDLRQNYPNPFNPTTAITFSLDRMGTATLDVFNLKGELVCNLASGTFAPGRHTVAFDGTNLASGIYVYRLKMDEQTLQNKMVLLK
ncbi:MAG: T9SS type A sorting domain-containing protein [bacterium]|nr:T9SS type A sorting domain-containing protein [bacterium]